jgi:hypothetical protein
MPTSVEKIALNWGHIYKNEALPRKQQPQQNIKK